MKTFSKVFDTPKGKGVNSKLSICEMHRLLYDLCVLELHDCKPELMYKMIGLLEQAFLMGVKMNAKLLEYKYNIREQDGLENTPEMDQVRIARAERNRLVKILTENSARSL